MSELAREYVLVPASEYKRKMTGKTTAINPFQNPDIRQAKKERSDMEIMNDDKSIPAEKANMMMNQILKRYRGNVARVTGKRSRATERTRREKTTGSSDVTGAQLNELMNALKAAKRPVGRVAATSGPSKIPRLVENRPRNVKASEPSPTEIDRAKTFMGGHLTSTDAKRVARLLKTMSQEGVISGKWNGKMSVAEDFDLTPGQMKDVIRDSYMSSPDRRSQPELVDRFRKKLIKRNIEPEIPASLIRESTRRKK